MRERLTQAAAELFQAQGYDETTIDEIAVRAGIGRRTFFRYYRTKEDVIFPDHDELLAKVHDRLYLSADESGLEAVLQAVRIVLRHYVETREISLIRYRLVSEVPALREREIVSVARYQRAFRERLGTGVDDGPSTSLQAEVVAASVAAAHNQVLRHWLRADGAGDPFPELDAALGYVEDVFRPAAPVAGSSRDKHELIVLAFDSSTPVATVSAELTQALQKRRRAKR